MWQGEAGQVPAGFGVVRLGRQGEARLRQGRAGRGAALWGMARRDFKRKEVKNGRLQMGDFRL